MPRGLRRKSAAARLLESWVRILGGHGCLSVVCWQVEGTAKKVVTRLEDSYRVCCILVCMCVSGIETSRMRGPWPTFGRSATKKKCIRDSNSSYINKWMCTDEGMYLFARGKGGTNLCTKGYT